MTRDEFAALDIDAAARTVTRLIASHESRYEIVRLLCEPDVLAPGVPVSIAANVRNGMKAQAALDESFARQVAQTIKALLVETRPNDWLSVIVLLVEAHARAVTGVIDGILKDLDAL